MKKRKSVYATLGMVLTLAWSASSFAHVHLVKSVPEKNAVLSEAPSQIQLWFTGKVAAEWSQVVVTDSKGLRVDMQALSHGDDPRHLVEKLKPLAPGDYNVKLNVVSGDGHRVKESFSFSIQ